MPVTLQTGLFSGLDTGSIISELLQLERQPIQSLSIKRANAEAKISAFGTMKSAISKLRNLASDLKQDQIFNMSTSSGDESVFTASATTSASNGEYNIKVKQLASSQTLVSGSFAATNSEVADLGTYATQTLRMSVGGSSTDITINSDNNTLSGLADAINGSGLSVSATVVNTGFDVTASNNTLMFNDGSDRTATLTAGTYSADELAAEIKRAMESVNGGTDTYSVSYDTASLKFDISNDGGNTNSIDLLFENAGTTAESLLGYDATDHAALAVGSTVASDNAVGSQRLILSATDTGTANRISIVVDEDYNGTFEEAAETDTTGLSQLAFNPSYDVNGNVDTGTANLTQSQAAVDAKLEVDGLSASRSTNSISDLITGVTIDLQKVDTSQAYLLRVDQDFSSISGRVNAFVSSYNQATGLTRSLSQSDASGSSILSRDPIARGMLRDLRNLMTTKMGDYTPATLGLSHTRDGVLTLDTNVLDSVLADDFEGALATFDEFATDMEGLLDSFLDSSIPARTEGLQSDIDRYGSQIETINRRVDLKELQLTKTFSLLEKTLGQLQSSSDFLTQQMANISTIGNRNSRR